MQFQVGRHTQPYRLSVPVAPAVPLWEGHSVQPALSSSGAYESGAHSSQADAAERLKEPFAQLLQFDADVAAGAGEWVPAFGEGHSLSRCSKR